MEGQCDLSPPSSSSALLFVLFPFVCFRDALGIFAGSFVCISDSLIWCEWPDAEGRIDGYTLMRMVPLCYKRDVIPLYSISLLFVYICRLWIPRVGIAWTRAFIRLIIRVG